MFEVGNGARPRRNALLLAVAALAIAGCGSASVTYHDANTTPVRDAAGAAELMKAAGDKAVVVNVPVSRIMISMSPHRAAQPDPNVHASVPRSAVPVVLPAVFHPGFSGMLLPVKDKPAAPAAAAPAGGNPHAGGGSGTETGTGTSVLSQTITRNSIDYVVSYIPIPSSDLNLRVTPVNDFWSRNELSITKIAGTDIPHVVSNQFTDMTETRVAEIGDLVKATMGLMGFDQTRGTSCDQEITIDATAEHMRAADDGKPRLVDDGKAACWAFRFVPDANPHQADIVSRTAFHSQATAGESLKAWPVTACWSGSIELYDHQSATAPDVSLPVTVIDPEYVRMVGIPDKGAITMHPVCGADVSDSPVDKWADAFAVLNALETKAAAVAGSKTKSGSTKPSGGTSH